MLVALQVTFAYGTTRLTKALVSWIDAMRDQPRLRARQACGEEGASNQLQCQLQTDGLRMQESGGTCVGDTYGAVAPLHTSVAPLIAGTQMHFAHWGALRARHLSSPPGQIQLRLEWARTEHILSSTFNYDAFRTACP